MSVNEQIWAQYASYIQRADSIMYLYSFTMSIESYGCAVFPFMPQSLNPHWKHSIKLNFKRNSNKFECQTKSCEMISRDDFPWIDRFVSTKSDQPIIFFDCTLFPISSIALCATTFFLIHLSIKQNIHFILSYGKSIYARMI